MIHKFITHRDTNEGLFTLSIEGILPLLVLGNFVRLVLLALFAVSPAGLWNVHLLKTRVLLASLQIRGGKKTIGK